MIRESRSRRGISVQRHRLAVSTVLAARSSRTLHGAARIRKRRSKGISSLLRNLKIALILCSELTVFPAQATDYDLVILNGRVMDPETNLDAVRNVGIRDGGIEAVTKSGIKGNEAIGAKGHVVAPGFIDPRVRSR